MHIHISVYGYTYIQYDGNFRETLTHMGTCYSGLVRAHVSWREKEKKQAEINNHPANSMCIHHFHPIIAGCFMGFTFTQPVGQKLK